MKKIFFLSIFILLIISNISLAVVDRSQDNLGINKDICITPWVKKAVLATPKVDSSEKIYDYAELLTKEEENKIFEKIKDYITETNIDMAIVTISENNKNSAMEYADDFYDYNDFGIDNVYSGILFLIDMENREMWISTTGNAILIYNDDRINNILDKAFVHIYTNYYNTIDTFINLSKTYALNGIPEGNEEYYIDNEGRYRKKLETVDYAVSIISSLVMATTFTTLIVMKQKNKKKVEEAEFYEKKFRYTKENDLLISNKTTKTYIASSSSSSSGSSGGYSSRSSTHSSSSGRSHGGGGRRF